MGTVFVVQTPGRRAGGEWVTKYDLSPATEFGELHHILKPGTVFLDKVETARRALEDALMGFNDDDSILAVGDPIAIALGTMIASRNNGGKVHVLKYDRIAQRYQRFPLEV